MWQIIIPPTTCSNCKGPGHTVDHCWAKGGGAEGKGPKMRPSKGNLKGKGKKAGLAKVTKDNQSLSPPPAVYITHAKALISKDTSNPRETSISTLQPQTIYVTPKTTFPHIGNSNPLGELKPQTDIAMPSVLATSLSVPT